MRLAELFRKKGFLPGRLAQKAGGRPAAPLVNRGAYFKTDEERRVLGQHPQTQAASPLAHQDHFLVRHDHYRRSVEMIGCVHRHKNSESNTRWNPRLR